MINKDEVYKIGRLGKAHGINGEVSMQVDDDIFDRTDAEYLILELDGIMVPFFMEEYRFKTDETALIKFEGIDTMERARELTGAAVYFPTPSSSSQDGEVTYAMLVGFTVIDFNNNKKIGKIAYIDEQTINTMFELTDGTLIPASEELIEDVDIDGKTVTINIPEGLL